MREYAPTPTGESLAIDSGLDTLAIRLSEKDYYPPTLLQELIRDGLYGYGDVSKNDMTSEIEAARTKLKTQAEIAMFDQALGLDPQADRWRHIGGIAKDTLFPVNAITDYAKSTDEDRFILSGGAGLILVNFRQRCPLLARSRYQEFGFQTFNEACAFAGSYIVGRLVSAETRKFKGDPSFTYTEDGLIYTVDIGGTMHGDFRMEETRMATSNIVSPIKTVTEFGPKQSIVVSGYHSIEPDIVASLIEAEFLRSGKEAAEQLTDDFIGVFEQSIATDPRDSNKTPFVVPPFADFGDGDVRYSLISLGLLLTRDNYNPLSRSPALHRSSHLPQSNVMFEIVPTEEGVRFQNGNDSYESNAQGISIGRDHYLDLFRALVEQTSAGLGRTAPSQLLELVYRAKEMFDGNLEDYKF